MADITATTTMSPVEAYDGCLDVETVAAADEAKSRTWSFLPDFTEHPKRPTKRTTKRVQGRTTCGGGGADGGAGDNNGNSNNNNEPEKQPVVESGRRDSSSSAEEQEEEESQVTFMQDFVAGGIAGSISIMVGHPFDTIKVRMQTQSTNAGLLSMLGEFGGSTSLFRGLAAPLSMAAVVNAVVFSSYGLSSRLYDEHIINPALQQQEEDPTSNTFNHDPWQKAMVCGSFAGLVQCLIICPTEGVKCRMQVQHGRGAADNKYKGSLDAARTIFREHGLTRLYQGWWVTCLREVPAFGMYFASYDYLKDRANSFLAHQAGIEDEAPNFPQHRHSWFASAFAGGCAGSLTWAAVYPVDVVKTRIQTAPLDAPARDLSMIKIGRSLVAQHGWRYLFRGLGVTLIRAFPVNGTIFPVYEFTLMQMAKLGE